jgi:hypothetical protein
VTPASLGRNAGTDHPRAGRAAVLVGVVVSLLLVAAVLLGSRGPGPLDQPDAARQRDGLVLDGPTVAPTVVGVHLRDLPNVLLFVRETPQAEVLDAWRQSLPAAAEVTVVVQGPGPGHDGPAAAEAGEPAARRSPGLVDVVSDPDEVLATAVRLPEPVDGGPGVGYAVIDADGVVRYSTLDPAWADNAFEVATILGSPS